MKNIDNLKANSIEQGTRIKQLRELTLLSRRAFAKKHKISFGTLQSWEDGRSKEGLSENSAIILAIAFTKEGYLCSKEWILYGTGEAPYVKNTEKITEENEQLREAVRNNKQRQLNQALYDATLGNRRAEIIKYIDQGADLHKADNYKIHVFNEAENSLLHLAVLNGSIEQIKLLLSKGMDINLRNRRGESVLHMAISKGHTQMIPFLISQGIDINVTENEGDTSLAWAAYTEQTTIADCLISMQADLNHQNKIGNTAMHWAAYRGFYDIVKNLIKSGANKNIQNRTNKKPIDLAIENGHIDVVELLLHAE